MDLYYLLEKKFIMNVVIVGQGAIGLLWYVQLHAFKKAQLSSNLPSQLSALSLRPSNYTQSKNTPSALINFTDNQENFTEHHLLYATDNDIASADILLMTVKSYQVKKALSELQPLIQKECSIILSHNGLGTLEELPVETMNHHSIYSLLTTHGCLRTDSLSITHTGKGHCDLGLVSGNHHINESQQLTNLLHQAFPDVIWHKNIAEKQWLKLAINCVINPITALNNIFNGEVNSPEYSSLIKGILVEVVAVSNSQGIFLDLTALMKTVADVANATAKNQSSMLCDVQKKNKTEIDFINGYIHRIGEKMQIKTPLNTRLWQEVNALTE
tara:strand:- start:117 stop:1100 length:984 start_codon:yes stop_codon:yes gene_type:complete